MLVSAWTLMTEARRNTPLFIVPEAHALTTAVAAADIEGAAFDACLQAAKGPLDRSAIDAALALLAPPFDRHPDLPEDAALDCHHSDDPHDTFFRIARSEDGLLRTLLTAALRAQRLFLDETPLPSERSDYAELGAVLQVVLTELLDSTLAGSAPLVLNARQAAPAPLMRAADPLRRWLHGHQIFAVLTQGLVRRLQHVVAAVESDAMDQLPLQLQGMAALYRASALAFRFTADFEPDIYSSVIRPSMCEPYTPKGFSGTLSSDHGMLVKLLVGHREALATAAERCPQDYADMREAIAAVYDDHKYVCARFDGDRSPSLRTSGLQGSNTAVDMLERFRTRRIAMLP